MSDKILTEAYAKLTAIEESTDPQILHDAAIDMLDDMLHNASINQYHEKADVLRYAITRLQQVGLGR